MVHRVKNIVIKNKPNTRLLIDLPDGYTLEFVGNERTAEYD